MICLAVGVAGLGFIGKGKARGERLRRKAKGKEKPEKERIKNRKSGLLWKAHLTLYTVIGSPQHILTGIQSLFAPVIQSVDTEADQIRVTLQDDSLLVFHLSHVREKAGL